MYSRPTTLRKDGKVHRYWPWCGAFALAMRRSTRDRLYRGFDHLLVQKAALEAHLSQSCGELFAIENEVLLYDVTSTYFDQNALRAGEGRRLKGEGSSPHGRGTRGRARARVNFSSPV